MMCRQIIIILAVSCLITESNTSRSEAVDELGKTTAEIVRLRGYLAEDYFVQTSEGYLLNVVRATNPLINNGKGGLPNKDVVLFIHGTLVSSSCFIVNSVGVEPRDYSGRNAGNMSSEDLNEMLLQDSASKSLVFTALNFGHEVWLLNRRGTPESLGSVGREIAPSINPLTIIFETLFGGLKSSQNEESEIVKVDKKMVSASSSYLSNLQNAMNPRYWNYSLDEQAYFDLPEVVDYVLKKVGRDKLAVVSHSAGGAIVLMGLVEHPELADKFTKNILWAPAMDLGDDPSRNPLIAVARRFAALFVGYLGPIPPAVIETFIHDLSAAVCSNYLTQVTVCESLLNLITGPGGGQQVILPGFLQAFIVPISSHEIIQLAQQINKIRAHKFDYYSRSKNLIAYGQVDSPEYQVSRIRDRGMSIWTGGTDTLVTIADTKLLLEDLIVPVEQHYINQTGVFFNHASFFLHQEVAKLLVIPSLKTLES